MLLGSSMLLYVSLAVFTIVAIKFFQKRNEPATFGIYQKPGKWYFLKLLVIFLMIKARKVMYMCKHVICLISFTNMCVYARTCM
jgi:hypothetical protein